MTIRRAAMTRSRNNHAGGGSAYADIERRWWELSDCAAGIAPTQLPLEPAPGDFDLLADDLRVLARTVDALVEAYGDYLDANAPDVDRTLFKDVLHDALDGNALYEIEQAAQQLRQDDEDLAYYTRHNRHPAAE